jgi:2-dehydro-3-deoxygalactonokinase
MVTSRQGWVELPYLACPTDAAGLAGALHHHQTASGLDVHFVTGLTVIGADGVPDVMRGEETQIAGALSDGAEPRLFVLPGTHSKWVLCDGGRIVWFATFMTGEVYAVLRQHSILGRLIETEEESEHWFDRGVEYGASTDAGAGGLLKKLFGTRALRLFDAVPADGAASHLSGLLIGTEIQDALRCVRERHEIGDITILGETDLASLYTRALAGAGLTIADSPANAAARGQWLIARAAGLIEDHV